MPFNGKRTARERIPSQVNLDPDLSGAIRISAELNMRPIGNEIVCLLTDAILNHPKIGVYAQFRTNAHVMAPPRKITHINEQRRSA